MVIIYIICCVPFVFPIRFGCEKITTNEKKNGQRKLSQTNIFVYGPTSNSISQSTPSHLTSNPPHSVCMYFCVQHFIVIVNHLEQTDLNLQQLFFCCLIHAAFRPVPIASTTGMASSSSSLPSTLSISKYTL